MAGALLFHKSIVCSAEKRITKNVHHQTLKWQFYQNTSLDTATLRFTITFVFKQVVQPGRVAIFLTFELEYFHGEKKKSSEIQRGTLNCECK